VENFAGSLAIGGHSIESCLDTRGDEAFLRFTRIHLQDVPGRIAGTDLRLVVGAGSLVYMDHLITPVYEDHVQGNIGVLHPEVMHVVPVIDEKHAGTAAHRCSEHQPPDLLLRCYRRLGLKAAEFLLLSIMEGHADTGKVNGIDGKRRGNECDDHEGENEVKSI